MGLNLEAGASRKRADTAQPSLPDRSWRTVPTFGSDQQKDPDTDRVIEIARTVEDVDDRTRASVAPSEI